MHMKLSGFFFVSILFFLFFAKNIFAEDIKQVRLTVTDDTYISQSSPDAINGNKTFLTAKAQSQNYNLILLKFSTSQVPKGSDIGSATLLMTSYSCSGADTTPTLELYDSINDWNEDTARWNGRPRQGMSQGIKDATPQTKSWDVTSKVNTWVQGSSNNYGLIVTVQGGEYTCNFYSKEKTNDSINLVVKFIPPDSTKPIISQAGVQDIKTNAATITWTTDEDSTSFVDYYTSSSSNMFIPNVESAGRNDNAKAHSVALQNLTAGKKYYYRVRSKDIAGNQSTSNYTNFTTKSSFLIIPTIKLNLTGIQIQDTAPLGSGNPEDASASTLAVSDVTTGSVTETSVKITWKTSEPANSYVYYSSGLADQEETPEFQSIKKDEVVTDHEMTITGLKPDTKYDFYVASATVNDEGTASPTDSFTTLNNEAQDTKKSAKSEKDSKTQEEPEKNTASESSTLKKIGNYIANLTISQDSIIIALLVIIALLLTGFIIFWMKIKSLKKHSAKSHDEEKTEKEDTKENRKK